MELNFRGGHFVSITVIIRRLNFCAAVSTTWNLVSRHRHEYEFKTNLNICRSIFCECQSIVNTAKISPSQKYTLYSIKEVFEHVKCYHTAKTECYFDENIVTAVNVMNSLNSSQLPFLLITCPQLPIGIHNNIISPAMLLYPCMEVAMPNNL